MTTEPTVQALAYRNLQVSRRPPLATITINRPRVLNALNDATLGEINQALDELDADDTVRAIIITGSGSKAFSAGADIGELEALTGAHDGYEHSRHAHGVLLKIQRLGKPVIAAVNGYALGGGCELVLGCDIILASENARFGQPEVTLGIIPGFGGTQRLPRLVGRTRGLELILTGEHITADEAQRIGLVNRVVAADELIPAAEAMGRTIAEKAPLAVALAKRAIYEGLEAGLGTGNQLEMTYFGLAVGTDDRREGTRAFLQKRKAEWQGK